MLCVCPSFAKALKHTRLPLAAVLALFACVPAQAQFFGNRTVGGVSIDADHLVQSLERDQLDILRRQREQMLQPASAELNAKNPLRKISLRQLEAAIRQHQQTGKKLPDEIVYLAGLQRIRYVFVYPELRDIVLVGPGEGWKVSADGEVVGIQSGRPVMQLDDLLVALRSAGPARQVGISCSIDPTAEGMARLRGLVEGLQTTNRNGQSAMDIDAEATLNSIEQALGKQTITVTGVPDTSHFARVIVAADYKMKRLAMNFEPSPVRGMPSYLEMSKAGPRGMQNMLPRWWIAADYSSIRVDDQRLAFELRGAGAKVMTEDDFVNESGAREHTGKANPVAQRWADNMTKRYDELAQKASVFGALQNCMDLAIVSALVAKEELASRAGLDLGVLLDEAALPVAAADAPKQVDSKASVLKKGSNYLISASGGVQIEPWQIADRTETSSEVGQAREASASAGDQWWWN